jgi:hypothetical protein
LRKANVCGGSAGAVADRRGKVTETDEIAAGISSDRQSDAAQMKRVGVPRSRAPWAAQAAARVSSVETVSA